MAEMGGRGSFVGPFWLFLLPRYTCSSHTIIATTVVFPGLVVAGKRRETDSQVDTRSFEYHHMQPVFSRHLANHARTNGGQ